MEKEKTDQEIKDALIQRAAELAAKEVKRQEERREFMAKMQHKMMIERMKVQHACSHRKGTAFTMMVPDIDSPNFLSFKPTLPPFKFDFCVIKHTFINGLDLIKCVMCGREWRTGDSDFDEADKMVEASSNRPSASEHVLHPEPNVPQGAVKLVLPLRKSFWRRLWDATKEEIAFKKELEEVGSKQEPEELESKELKDKS